MHAICAFPCAMCHLHHHHHHHSFIPPLSCVGLFGCVNPKVSESTVIKQSKRGLTLILNPTLVHFTLNTHLTPQGLVDILHHRREPRPVSDCSFRPWPGAFAINDWTNKINEPALHFADDFQQFCIWHWNLAISYPKHDLHTGDDDLQCAFPRVKSNPNMVAMHNALSHDTLIMHTGLNI